MKRTLVIAVALVALLGLFTACSSNDSSTSPVGTWNLTALDLTENGSTVHFTSAMLQANDISITATVKSDNTFMASGMFEGYDFALTGAWSQSGSTISFTLSDGSSGTATISGNTMTATGTLNGDPATFTLTRS